MTTTEFTVSCKRSQDCSRLSRCPVVERTMIPELPRLQPQLQTRNKTLLFTRRNSKTRADAEEKEADPSRQKQRGVKSRGQVEYDEANDAWQKEKTVGLRAQVEDNKTPRKIGPRPLPRKRREPKRAPRPKPLPVLLSLSGIDACPRKGERTRHVPRLADGMAYHEHANTKNTYKVMSTAKAIALVESDENAAPPMATTALQKTLAKTTEKKNTSPSRGTHSPGLEPRRRELEKQARRELQTPADIEIEEQITKRTAKMADRLTALTRSNQELWLESQAVLDEFLGYAAYVGDEEDVSDARAKFDRVRKRNIRGETYDWPVAKRVREDGVHD
ncbi:hypothetical protein PSPO01_00834 [Paraphaeosphaeria sporulosa]